MKVLWLCNIVLPDVAGELGIPASNKEGWLSGICSAVTKSKDFELHICFPMDREHDGFFLEKNGISYYGFFEDTAHPELYDRALEDRLSLICDRVKPDVIHIFGTEYPHTLAMCRVMRQEPQKLLVGIQGILEVYKDRFFDGVPKRVIDRNTFRDIVRRDTLKIQQHKYEMRAVNEVEAVMLAGNLTGRTPFDKAFHDKYSPTSNYYFMNETLRPDFYDGAWDEALMEKHSVFLSQANYPIKGGHYFLEAMPAILERFPDTRVYIAGDNITRHASFTERLKLSSYGKYLLELIEKYDLEEHVIFLGSIDAGQVKERLLKANVFACTSTIENSPNSLGEAMLLGVPCLTADVGGIRGIFDEGSDGIMYSETEKDKIVSAVSAGVIRLFEDTEFAAQCGKRASEHAAKTHNPTVNYLRLLEIYHEISGQ